MIVITQNKSKLNKAISDELLAVRRQEERLSRSASKAKPAGWKEALESKIPEKVYSGLESAFCKGFTVVFKQGRAIIEKSFDKEEIKSDQTVRDYAVQLKGVRKELKQIQNTAQKSDLLNLAATTVEGIGLGALGIGLPDIVLFLGTLLRGIYQIALNYGFDYESPQEQMLILKMMAASLSTGQQWSERNYEVDEILQSECFCFSDEDFREQLKATSSVFATDMLILKWIQGMPIVGIIGGASNPVYYRKVMKYCEIKYHKRYLLMQRSTLDRKQQL